MLCEWMALKLLNQASNGIVAKDYRKYLQNLKWGLASPPILHGPKKTAEGKVDTKVDLWYC